MQSPTSTSSSRSRTTSPIGGPPRTAALCAHRVAASIKFRGESRWLRRFARLEFERELHRGEGAAVMRRQAEGLERGLMLGRAIADIGVPAIAAIAAG